MLTPAPRCPVQRFRETARVTCRRKQGAHKSAHSAQVSVTPTVTRHRYCHPENHAGKGFFIAWVTVVTVKSHRGMLLSPVSLRTAFDRSRAAQTL